MTIQLSFMFPASTKVPGLCSLNDGLRLGCVELTTPFFHKFFLVMLFITAAESEPWWRLLLENSILMQNLSRLLGLEIFYGKRWRIFELLPGKAIESLELSKLLLELRKQCLDRYMCKSLRAWSSRGNIEKPLNTVRDGLVII